MAHIIEREQKFLIDVDEFSKLDLQNYKQIRQCYLSVERECAVEVRMRETTTPEVDRGVCDVCRRKPGRCWNCAHARDEHACHHCYGKGRVAEAATTTYTQTIKRRRAQDAIGRDEVEFAVHADDFEAAWSLSQWRVEKRRYEGGILRVAVHPEQLHTFDRIGRWGTCGGCPRMDGVVYPERCVETARYDHHITSVTSWQVDVFTSGPLAGAAVAEMEIEPCYRDVAHFLEVRKTPWPAWVVQMCARCGKLACGIHRLEPATTKPVDLTSLSVNLVAAGARSVPHTLRNYLDDLAAAKEARKLSAYTSAPRNRQGVVDLDKAAQRARRENSFGEAVRRSDARNLPARRV